MDELQREIEALEGRLDRASPAVDELATIRRGLTDGKRKLAIKLPNLRLGFACKQRWEDMIGDDRIRACGGCDRPVFNLSEMTSEDAERVLATRGLTPCVRFYRRPDGTVMTTDCPTGERREGRRLAVVASSLAAGSVLAAAPSARAEPAPASPVETPRSTMDDPAIEPTEPGITITPDYIMGLPPPQRTFEAVLPPVVDSREFEMGVMLVVDPPPRPPIEGSLWGRLGMGVGPQRPNILARGLTPPSVESGVTFEAALGAELTVGVARHGNIRLGAWGELRTSSGPVVGGELVLEGLPPHPYDSRIGGAGSVVLRAGGNGHVVTGALGFGYVGSWPRSDPWIGWANHVVGARIVTTLNHSLDNPYDWSVTLGLEVEPIGVVQAVLDLATSD